MPTPPMLRRRDPEPSVRTTERDPVVSLTVLFLGAIALALFIAAILAVYTYSTPGAEVPLVIAISLAFGLVLGVNLLAQARRVWRDMR